MELRLRGGGLLVEREMELRQRGATCGKRNGATPEGGLLVEREMELRLRGGYLWKEKWSYA